MSVTLQVEEAARRLAASAGVAAADLWEDEEEDNCVWIAASGAAAGIDGDTASPALSSATKSSRSSSNCNSSSGGSGSSGDSDESGSSSSTTRLAFHVCFAGCSKQRTHTVCASNRPWHDRLRITWHHVLTHMHQARKLVAQVRHSRIRRRSSARGGARRILQAEGNGACLAAWGIQGGIDSTGSCVHPLTAEARGPRQKQCL